MSVPENGAPEQSAQAPSAADNQSPPSQSDAQGQVETPQEGQEPQVPAGEVVDTKDTAPETPAVETQPKEETIPYWQSQGFNSEAEFVASYGEQRKTLGTLHRKTAELEKSTQIYQDFLDGKLDIEKDDVKQHVETARTEAAKKSDEDARQMGIKNQEANLALERFKVRHAGENLTNQKVLDIISMASTSQSSDMFERLEHGLKRYKGVENAAKVGTVKATQDQMQADANMGPTGATAKGSDKPDFKNMSSDEFAKYKLDLART